MISERLKKFYRRRLAKMLLQSDYDNLCPASHWKTDGHVLPVFGSKMMCTGRNFLINPQVCDYCRSFVDLPIDKSTEAGLWCPCSCLGKVEAKQRALQALFLPDWVRAIVRRNKWRPRTTLVVKS